MTSRTVRTSLGVCLALLAVLLVLVAPGEEPAAREPAPLGVQAAEPVAGAAGPESEEPPRRVAEAAPELPVEIRTGTTLSGRVAGPSGEGIPGIVVRAQEVCPDRSVPATSSAVSDPEGRFRIVVDGAVPWDLSTDSTAEWRSDERFRIDDPRAAGEVEIRMVRMVGSVTGFVRSADGAAVEGAEVLLESSGAGGTVRTTSGEDGGFRATGLACGCPVTIVARREGYEAGRSSALPDAGSVEVVLRRGQCFEVTVLSSSTRAPVPEARVKAAVAARGGTSVAARLDVASRAPGRFLVSGVAEDARIVVLASARGFERREVVRSPGDLTPLTIRLDRSPPVEIRGRVLDESGRPVPGVSVNATEMGTTVPLASGATTAGAHGEFRIEKLTGGRSYRLRALSASGALVGEWAGDPEDTGAPVELRLTRAGFLAGELSSGDPAIPIRGARLRVDRFVPDEGAPRDGFPAENEGIGSGGRFRIGWFLPGAYDLTILSATHAPVALRSVRLDSGRTTRLGRMVLDPLVTWGLRLLDPAGRPAAGVAAAAVDEDGGVWVFPPTDGNGRTTRGLPSGCVRLVAGGDGLPLSVLAVRTLSDRGIEDDEYSLPPSGRLRIRVTHADGSPAPAIPVEILADTEPPCDTLPAAKIPPWWQARMREGPGRDLLEGTVLRTDAVGELVSPPLAGGGHRVRVGAEVRDVEVVAGREIAIGVVLR